MKSAKSKVFVTDDKGYDYQINLHGDFYEDWDDLILDLKSVYVTVYFCTNKDDEYVEPSEDYLISLVNPYDVAWNLV